MLLALFDILFCTCVCVRIKHNRGKVTSDYKLGEVLGAGGAKSNMDHSHSFEQVQEI